MTSPEVLCIGVATVDTIAIVDRIPGHDERVVSDPFVTAGGGPAATAAVTLARLGVPVAFCGVVGDDAAGSMVREALEEEGVDTAALKTRPGEATPQSTILVDRASAARTIITTPVPRLAPEDVPTTGARWVHVDHSGFAAVRGVDSASRPSLSVDGGNPIPELQLAGVELYAPTALALQELFPGTDLEESMRRAEAAGARHVIATVGARGSYVLSGGEVTHVPPFPVDAVSTMGAGDVFHGALLAGLLDGLALVDAARWAGAVAALSCRALDGRSGIPGASETQKYLAEMMAKDRA